jgi:hypothetical protein
MNNDVKFCYFNPNLLFTGGENGTFCGWDLRIKRVPIMGSPVCISSAASGRIIKIFTAERSQMLTVDEEGVFSF